MNKCIYRFYIIVLFVSCTNNNESSYITYHPNGIIKQITPQKNKMAYGQVLAFNEAGILEACVLYKNGLKNGNAYYFYQSGALRKHRYYLNDISKGYVCDYFDDSLATIKAVHLFDDSGHIIYTKEFNHNGQLIRKIGDTANLFSN